MVILTAVAKDKLDDAEKHRVAAFDIETGLQYTFSLHSDALHTAFRVKSIHTAAAGITGEGLSALSFIRQFMLEYGSVFEEYAPAFVTHFENLTSK